MCLPVWPSVRAFKPCCLLLRFPTNIMESFITGGGLRTAVVVEVPTVVAPLPPLLFIILIIYSPLKLLLSKGLFAFQLFVFEFILISKLYENIII